MPLLQAVSHFESGLVPVPSMFEVSDRFCIAHPASEGYAANAVHRAQRISLHRRQTCQ